MFYEVCTYFLYVNSDTIVQCAPDLGKTRSALKKLLFRVMSGPCWVYVGPTLAVSCSFGAMLSPCWAHVGPRTACSFGWQYKAQMNTPFCVMSGPCCAYVGLVSVRACGSYHDLLFFFVCFYWAVNNFGPDKQDFLQTGSSG